MRNHIKGTWFVSVFKMRNMTDKELQKIIDSDSYRATTRRNALNEMAYRAGSYS